MGGDGTFLEAARNAGRTPLLGVNSDPTRSEAAFSAATARTFPRLVRLALKGQLRGVWLYRLKILLNGIVLPDRALNDVLLVHDDPATMSRYRLKIGGREEAQKSSGLWVSTAAGSSGAILAAGGQRLPWSARLFQYRPRELYRGRLSRHRLRGAILSARVAVQVTWLMRQGAAYIDGPHHRIQGVEDDRASEGDDNPQTQYNVRPDHTLHSRAGYSAHQLNDEGHKSNTDACEGQCLNAGSPRRCWPDGARPHRKCASTKP